MSRSNTGAMWFQHTAARRRLDIVAGDFFIVKLFQHTAARRRLAALFLRRYLYVAFQHTAARRRLESTGRAIQLSRKVSTHSRPKAAGFSRTFGESRDSGFNTQPPEGGW